MIKQRQRMVTRAAWLVVALLFGLSLVWPSLFPLVAGWPPPPHAEAAAAHALPVRSEPAADAVLTTPPQAVRIWFSEDLVPQTSRMLVVDTTNHQVDNQDSQVEGTREMQVTLPLLAAGTYVVVWRSQSVIDGHIASGSFLFRIARPDGTVPPIPAVLPTGHVPGAAGVGVSSTSTLDGPSFVQTLMSWLALLGMTFWVGGCLWETWVLPPGRQPHADLAHVTRVAGQRFRQLAPLALVLVLVADVGMVLGQSAELAGDWSGVGSFPLLRVILTETSFGLFWWLRQLSAGLALLLLWLQPRPRLEVARPPTRAQEHQENRPGGEASPLTWKQALKDSFLHLPHFPGHLVQGWRACPWMDKRELGLCAALLLAFALSGHAAAVTTQPRFFVLSIDLLHLLGNAAWVGGLLYLGMVLVPVLRREQTPVRARVLADGLPAFSAFALLSVAVLAATGSLNTTEHLDSVDQVLGTLYGQILSLKIGLFLLMTAISAYHAFRLRTRLAEALRQQAQSVTAQQETPHLPGREERAARRQAERIIKQESRRIAGWLQVEAGIGVAVLVCVALLAASAGTLVPSSPAAGSAAPGQLKGAFTQTQQVQGGDNVTLQITPTSFGTNTFTVTLHDAHGQPLPGASVLMETTMLDMDMGTQTLQLQAVPAQAGVYQGQSDLTMAGHWAVTLKVLLPGQNIFVQVRFPFTVG